MNADRSEIPNTDEDQPGFVLPLNAVRDLLGDADGLPFVVAASRDDIPMTALLFSPNGTDGQKPHDRDEIYVVVSGSGVFEFEGTRKAFKTGDMIYVKAHAKHSFVEFTDDFCTWVIFYGDKK